MKSLLKTLFVLLVLNLPKTASSQWVTIPDPNFVAWLNANGYSSCMNGSQMDTTCNAIVNAVTVNCSSSGLVDVTGIQYFKNLKYLYCDLNQLTFIPALTDSITNFTCRFNQITALNALPSSLRYLMCNDNLISVIGPLPPNLLWLACSNNPLTLLPALPNTLESLWCSGTSLSTLPTLSAMLWTLVCSNNPLLNNLPTLPSTLYHLQCENSSLDSLPAIPNGTRQIRLRGNQLTSIPQLPDTVFYLDIGNNPGITCLPFSSVMDTLYFDNTMIACLPGIIVVNISNPSIYGVPVCDPVNVSGCSIGYNIKGVVYDDSNFNCLADPFETAYKNIKIDLHQGGIPSGITYSDPNGVYTFKVSNGVYTYSPDTLGLPYMVVCPPAGLHSSTITPLDSVDIAMDFSLICKPIQDAGINSIVRDSGFFRPGQATLVNFIAGDLAQLYNMSCLTSGGGTLTVNYTGPLQFCGNLPGGIQPVTSPGTIVFNVTDFSTVNIYADFITRFCTDTIANIGDTICFSVVLLPAFPDAYPQNNSLSSCFVVGAGYDPNNKEVTPINYIPATETWLTYTINFQNTGTAPAQHIAITDTLDADVQEGTFSYLASSHQPFINVTGNIVRFSFPNINLPDSTTNEPGSHGWVQYKVKSDLGLALGTTIENTANIYFDFNPPVITNTTVNTVVMPTGISESAPFEFTVYPNPASGTVHIETPVSGRKTLRFYDPLGRLAMEKITFENTFKTNIEVLPAGIYLISFSGENGAIANRKLVVLK